MGGLKQILANLRPAKVGDLMASVLAWLRKLAQYSLGGLVGAVLAFLVCFVFLTQETTQSVRNRSYDSMYTVRLDIPHEDVVMLYMDEAAHRELNQPLNAPWDRAVHARLLERLKADGAAVVVFDVVFNDASTKESDEAFAKAIKDFGKVILTVDRANDLYGRTDVRGSQINPPLEILSDAAASIGLDELTTDEDLMVRKHPAISSKDLVFPLSWAAATLMGAPITKRTNEWARERWVNYYGPPAFLPNASYYRALTPNAAEALPPKFFRNKVVFIGSRLLTRFSGERKDEYPSPLAIWHSHTLKDKFMPGVEIQATHYLNLMYGDWLTRMPKFQEQTLLILLGVLFGFGLAQLRPFFAALCGVIGLAVIAVLAYYMATVAHVWFVWLVVEIEIIVALVWSIVFNSVNLYVQRRLMQQSLAMYVSPAQVRRIVKRPDILKPGAVKQELSILFSDIANFTSMSEGMDSDDLAKLMNNYFESAVGNCIQKTEGTVVKFIGDAIFAIWNAPELQSDHQDRACRGALLLRDEVSAFKSSKKGLEVRTRIGLHCGVANVGNFGSSKRIDYTALGENINLASRMEGLNKYLGTDILITGDVECAIRGRFVTRFLGQFRLKGFEKAVEVYELISLPDQTNGSLPWCEAFGQALTHFRQRQFDIAEKTFAEIIQMRTKDGPSKYYLKHLEELRAAPPPEGWAGEIELHEK